MKFVLAIIRKWCFRQTIYVNETLDKDQAITNETYFTSLCPILGLFELRVDVGGPQVLICFTVKLFHLEDNKKSGHKANKWHVRLKVEWVVKR